MIGAPVLFIAGVRWPDTLGADCPALAGATFTYDRNGQDQTERATVVILQRTDTPPAVVPDITRSVALYSPDLSTTYFYGSIEDVDVTFTRAYPLTDPLTGITGDPIPALRYTITAVDLAAPVRADMTLASRPAEDAFTRENYLKSQFDEYGWTGRYYVSASGTYPPCAPLAATQYEATLTLLDRTLAGSHRARRYSTKNDPTTHTLSRWIDTMDDPVTNAPTDLLRIDAAGAWHQLPGTTDSAGSYGIEIPSAMVGLEDLHWTKKRGDLLTEVYIERPGPPGPDGSPTTTRTAASSLLPELKKLQASSWLRSMTVSTDLDASATDDQLRAVARPWLPYLDSNGDLVMPFTTDALPVRGDIGDLYPPDVVALMSAETRYGNVVTVTGPIVNAPGTETQRPRGAVIGATATWTGRAWNLTLKLSRHPQRPAAGDALTCQSLIDAGGPAEAGTCGSVGDDLTCADFLWIGAIY